MLRLLARWAIAMMTGNTTRNKQTWTMRSSVSFTTAELFETGLTLVPDRSHDYLLAYVVVAVERDIPGFAARNDQLA